MAPKPRRLKAIQPSQREVLAMIRSATGTWIIFASGLAGLGAWLLGYSGYFLSVADWSTSESWTDLHAAADVHIRDVTFAVLGAVMLALAGACLWARFATRVTRGPRRLVALCVTVLGALICLLAAVGLFSGIVSAWVAGGSTLVLSVLVVRPAHRAVTTADPHSTAPSGDGTRPEPLQWPVVTILVLILATWVLTWPNPGGPAGAATPGAAVSGWVDALAADDEDRALDLAYPSPYLYSRTSRETSVAEILGQVGGQLRVDAVRITNRPFEGVVGTRLFGRVDGVPVCSYVALYRYDEESLLRRTRADGRWFVLPIRFSGQELDGTACELVGYDGPTG